MCKDLRLTRGRDHRSALLGQLDVDDHHGALNRIDQRDGTMGQPDGSDRRSGSDPRNTSC